MEILDDTPVFEIPLSRGCISYCLGLSQFRELTRHDIEKVTSNFP
jgi:hypothetical protein